MTIKIEKHAPPPVPPTTYTISGLTFHELHIIRTVFGHRRGGCNTELFEALRGTPGLAYPLKCSVLDNATCLRFEGDEE